MRNAAAYAGLLATSFASLGQAMVNLTILSSVDDVRFGDHVLVEWATDTTYVRPNAAFPFSTINVALLTHAKQSLEFNLVKKETYGWSVARSFFDERVAEAGEGNITVIVPRVEPNR